MHDLLLLQLFYYSTILLALLALLAWLALLALLALLQLRLALCCHGWRTHGLACPALCSQSFSGAKRFGC